MTFVAAVSVEPFLGLPSQLNEFPIRFQIPNLAGATGLKLQQITRPHMNQLSLISLIIFFFIQAAIYIWCLTKLAAPVADLADADGPRSGLLLYNRLGHNLISTLRPKK